MTKSKQVSEFSLEGQFLGFVAENGKQPKYLRVACLAEEYCIKLSKELRQTLDLTLNSGDLIQVVGQKKLGQSEIKLKARQVIAIKRVKAVEEDETQFCQLTSAKPKSKILVCQKSDCLKRGGKEVCQALATALSEQGLAQQVEIKATGCLKKCSAGPNLVMPDKTRYSRVKPKQVTELVNSYIKLS